MIKDVDNDGDCNVNYDEFKRMMISFKRDAERREKKTSRNVSKGDTS